MPFGTKAELIAAVADTLARPDLEAKVEDWITLTERDLERELDCTFEDATATGRLDGSGQVTLPPNCLYPHVLSILTTGRPVPVEFVSRQFFDAQLVGASLSAPPGGGDPGAGGSFWADASEWVDGSFWVGDSSGSGGSPPVIQPGVAGLPRYVTRVGDSLRYAPAGAHDYMMRYRALVERLREKGGGDTTARLRELFDLLFYGALAHSAPFLKADSRIALWSGIYQSMLRGQRVFEQKLRFGSGPLVMRPPIVL